MSYTGKVVELEDMKVAVFRADGPDPETKAVAKALTWAWKSGILANPATRIFGFDIPSSTSSHGYEVWVKVAGNTVNLTDYESVEFKHIPGSKYAYMECELKDIVETWKLFIAELKAEGIEVGNSQCLEEHLLPSTISGPEVQFVGVRLLESIA